MIRKLAAVILTAVTTSPAFAESIPEDYKPEIYASVYSSNYWKEHNFDEVGLYRFDADRYDRQLVMGDPYIDASGGGAMTEDFYFCTQEYKYGPWTDITHYIVDPDDWSITSSLRDGSPNAVATDLAYDPVTAKVYGCFNGEGDKMVFGTIDVSNGEVFRISDIDIPWIACSTDRNGRLYAVDMAGNLLSVDKVDGKTEKLGNLGFKATRRSTGAIDTCTGIFYVVVTNTETSDDPWIDYDLNDSHLYAVDIASATARHLYEFEDGEALGGMFIPGPAAAEGAPAVATDLSVDFPKGSLSGTVSFTVPACTFDGKEASGPVDYLIRANGELMAKGTSSYGEKTEVLARVSESASYKIELTLSNEAGRSPKTKIKTWLGPDMPKEISAPELSYADGMFTLSWKAPAESQNGGYFDPDKIAYNICREPDGAVVAEGFRSTVFTEAVEMPSGMKAYTYTVSMIYDGKPFRPVSSNIWRLGSASLPYKATFEDENSLDDFTRIDADGDKTEWYREWEFYVETTDELIPVVSYPYSPSAHGADDWLITPPFRLEKGLNYKLTYESLTDYAGDEPLLSVYLGQAPSVEAMSTCLQQATTITSLLPETHDINIAVDSDGLYYIGFHACSEAGKSAIAFTSISLQAENSGIAVPGTEAEVTIRTRGNSLYITSNRAEAYSIYSPDGRMIKTGFTAENDTCVIALAPGIYIIQAGKSTVKIALQ